LEENSSSATKEFPGALWNPEVRYLVCNSRPIVLILPKNNPIHKFPSIVFTFRSNIIISSIIHFQITVHTPFLLVVIYLIILITHIDEYKLWVPSLCHFLTLLLLVPAAVSPFCSRTPQSMPLR
jgi:hypothetical protein